MVSSWFICWWIFSIIFVFWLIPQPVLFFGELSINHCDRRTVTKRFEKTLKKYPVCHIGRHQSFLIISNWMARDTVCFLFWDFAMNYVRCNKSKLRRNFDRNHTQKRISLAASETEHACVILALSVNFKLVVKDFWIVNRSLEYFMNWLPGFWNSLWITYWNSHTVEWITRNYCEDFWSSLVWKMAVNTGNGLEVVIVVVAGVIDQ